MNQRQRWILNALVGAALAVAATTASAAQPAGGANPPKPNAANRQVNTTPPGTVPTGPRAKQVIKPQQTITTNDYSAGNGTNGDPAVIWGRGADNGANTGSQLNVSDPKTAAKLASKLNNAQEKGERRAARAAKKAAKNAVKADPHCGPGTSVDC